MSGIVDPSVLILKGLANPFRRLLFELLHIQELSGKDLCEILEADPGTISQHLEKMKNANLVVDRQEASFRYYRLQSLETGRSFLKALEEMRSQLWPNGPATLRERILAFRRWRAENAARRSHHNGVLPQITTED